VTLLSASSTGQKNPDDEQPKSEGLTASTEATVKPVELSKGKFELKGKVEGKVREWIQRSWPLTFSDTFESSIDKSSSENITTNTEETGSRSQSREISVTEMLLETNPLPSLFNPPPLPADPSPVSPLPQRDPPKLPTKFCKSCNIEIPEGVSSMVFQNSSYHCRCYFCSNCHVSLMDSRVFSHQNHLYCSDCIHNVSKQ